MGRRAKYNNPDDMQALIYEYFKDNRTPTITGLALALDLTRQGLINYEGKEEFADTVRQAKSQVEEILEQGLYGNVAGLMFNLKNNFGWKDKTELDIPKGFNISIGNKDADNA